MDILKKINSLKSISFYPIFLISLFPALLFLGSSIINFSVVIIDIFFLIELIKTKNLRYLNNKLFYLFIFLWISLLINLYFSIDPINSLGRSLGFIRFIIFIFAINFYLFNFKKNIFAKIIKFWSLIIFIIIIDLLFEFVFGHNLLGFKSYMPGRLSGFMNLELKIGYLFSALSSFSLTFFIYLIRKSKFFFKKQNLKNIIIYSLFIFALLISLMIGERANFVKFTLMLLVLFIFFEERHKFKKIISISIIFLIVAFGLSQIDTRNIHTKTGYYKYRFMITFIEPLSKNPIKFVKQSNYGSHYKAGIEIFKNYKFFGVGIKNYRIEAATGKYGNNTSIHPHEKHIEILSETGLFGYICFLIFLIISITNSIKIFTNQKNLYQLAGLIFIVANIIPVIPSGSFFSTYSATLFWLNFAFMIRGFNNKSLTKTNSEFSQ